MQQLWEKAFEIDAGNFTASNVDLPFLLFYGLGHFPGKTVRVHPGSRSRILLLLGGTISGKGITSHVRLDKSRADHRYMYPIFFVFHAQDIKKTMQGVFSPAIA